ncbi:hypothetical protein QWZ02_18520 [Kinneretia asaccharophila]|uniref:hypothetical protein n=1 Tax=Roseateles asaccharophilus TaxID=582607 RepID=UPI00106127F8|nr:hypothetical protein [Roseateles asaccharophilus]MDN3546457.1 hypothetical protein [Roseateles asaccharophilus]
MTPEQEVARKKRAVRAAQRMLTAELGLVYGAKRVREALFHLGSDVPKRFPAFDSFLDAIPLATPLGELRLLCQEALLLSSDRILAAVEAEYRQSLLRECLSVINVYESSGKQNVLAAED